MGIVNNATSKRRERKQRRHYLDVNLTGLGGTPAVYLLGEDIEELNREKTFDTESPKNILGVTTTTSTLGEQSIGGLTVYAREPDALTDLCDHLDETDAELDAIKRWYYEAVIDEDGETVYAFKQVADVKVTSAGGASTDPNGYTVDLTFSGDKIPQNYVFATDTFSDVGGGG
jgi:hypothetical protein